MALGFAQAHKRRKVGDKIGMSDDDNVRANALVVKEGGNMRRERKGRGDGVVGESEDGANSGSPGGERQSSAVAPDSGEILAVSSEMLSGSVMSNTRICGLVKPVRRSSEPAEAVARSQSASAA